MNDLSIRDDPQVFGMHENANINYQFQESERMMTTILSIQPRVMGQAGGKSPDMIIMEQAEAFLEMMPPDLDPADGNEELFEINEMGLIPSLSTVLLQEMNKFNTLLNQMRTLCKNLVKAIQGFVVMS